MTPRPLRLSLLTGWLVGLLFLAAGCATVPITGRSQLNMMSDQEMITAANASFSRFMSAVQQKNSVLSPSDSSQATATLESVQRVSDRIIDASGMRDQYNWRTVVVKASEPNAFVMPNGKIVVFTGLLPVVKNEAGLAAVLGHEVGHVMARHQAERMTQALLAQIAVVAVDITLAVAEPRYQPAVGAALGLGAQYGILLPFSRAHESEADRIGVLLMAKAGYDPSEAVGVWERMEATTGSGPWQFLSTHPSHKTRQAQLTSWLPEANLYYADRTRPLPATLAELEKARAAHAEKMALAPTAPRPSLQAGFWERTQVSDRPDPVTSHLERVEPCAEGECLVYEADTGRTSIQTTDHTLVEVQYPDGSWVRFSPPLQVVQWPLRVGHSWTQDAVIERSSGSRRSVLVKGAVVSYEAITVPAGSFMAFKIVLTMGGARSGETWYAPEARTIVRSISYDSRGGQVVKELLDYQKGEDPVGATAVPPTKPR